MLHHVETAQSVASSVPFSQNSFQYQTPHPSCCFVQMCIMSSLSDFKSSKVVWVVYQSHATQHTFARIANHNAWPRVTTYHLGHSSLPDNLPDPYHYPYLCPRPYP